MEEQKLSTQTVQEETNRIFSKRDQVIEVFKKNGFEENDRFDINRTWFISQLGQDQQHPIWSMLQQAENIFDKHKEEFTTSQFIDLHLSEIKIEHLKILDLDLNINYMKDNLVELQKASQRIDKNEIPYESQENAVIVSYVKDKTNISEIFKFYRIKYHAATVHQNYHEIFPENSNRANTLWLDKTVDKITFAVLGKRLDKNLGDDFKQLCLIEMPMEELFQSIRTRHFSLPTIPHIYLLFSYVDETIDAPYLGANQLELRFDLRLGQSERKRIVKQLQQNYEEMISQLEINLKNELEIMDKLMLPFKGIPTLQYVKARGLGDPQKDFPPQNKTKVDTKDKDKPRDECCKIQ